MKTISGLLAIIGVIAAGLAGVPVGSVQAQCFNDNNSAYVGLWWVGADSCADEVSDAIWHAYWVFGLTSDLEWDEEIILSNDPDITLLDVEEDLWGKRTALFSTHGGVDGSVALEYWGSQLYAEQKAGWYTGSLYLPEDIRVMPCSTSGGIAWVIAMTPAGIQSHFRSSLDPNSSMVYGDYCSSGVAQGAWLASTFLGYEGPVDHLTACDNLKKVWNVLGCHDRVTGGPYVDRAMTAGVSQLKAWGFLGNQIRCQWECIDVATAFDGAGAFDGQVWWLSRSEVGSVDFTVRGYTSDRADPETLAVVPATGGYGVRQFYSVTAAEGYRYYDVVERDAGGMRTQCSRFGVGARPADWDLWMAHPRVDADEGWPVQPAQLWEWVDGVLVPVRTISLVQGLSGVNEPPDPPPDDALCADVVIYSSTWSFVPPVLDHVVSEGLKARSFVGSEDPENARSAYTQVINANQDYLDECRQSPYWPDDCGDYPVSPGPLLIIVGDAGGPMIVGHKQFPDDHGRCATWACQSDFDIADIDGDGTPEGPVTRIPGDSLAEIEMACTAAQEFNSAMNVDAGRHLITLAGDRGLYEAEVGPIPVDFLNEVVDAYSLKGFVPRPMLIESDFPLYAYAELRAAAREQINSGALEVWGFGFQTGSPLWPGHFVEYDVGEIEQMTLQQRMIAWVPGCEIAASWRGDPVIEPLMFNGMDRTMLAACVGHLSGAWESQHRYFGRLLLDERMRATSGRTVASVVYDAVVRAQSESPWLFNFARSVGVLGGYVKVPGRGCPGGRPCAVMAPDSSEVWSNGIVHSIEWGLCYSPGENGRVRKHEIDLTTDAGGSWGVIADSLAPSTRLYEWAVDAPCSQQCRVRVISRMDTLRLADSLWVQAYACTCTSSGLFTIEGSAGVGQEPSFAMSLTGAMPVRGTALSGRFSVPSKCAVSIDVYDVRGRSVRRLFKDMAYPGSHQFEWDLRSAWGTRVAAGVYFVRLNSESGVIIKKVVIER